jgi:DNA-binding NarL/FixJ family response regulator
MKVLIADDHPLFRASIAHALKSLEDDVTVVEAADFEAASKIAESEKDFDLVLLDLIMPGMEPIEGLQRMIALLPKVPVIVVSAIENRRDALQTIDLGATGYIPKTVSEEEFVNMLKVVLAGGLCLPRNFSERAVASTPRREVSHSRFASGELLAGLTNRQRQVLALLAEGKSNIEIAADLSVSDKTIRFYISAILKTLKVRNRTQAALIAARAMEIFPAENSSDTH